MLVLSRKLGETIIIGDNIQVRVLAINGNQVRLGFEAPRSVSIQRQELLETPTPDAVVQARPEKAQA
ncbi:MAG: carbon storage regulator CsrA [Gemmataceae bacterium]